MPPLVLVGNGTVGHPDGGLLIGDGYSPDPTTCGTVCNGANGGSGGSAGLFGNGGDGGAGAGGGPGDFRRHAFAAYMICPIRAASGHIVRPKP